MKKISLILGVGLLLGSISANASNYRDIAEQLIQKPGSSWKWSDLDSLKNVTWNEPLRSYNHQNVEHYVRFGQVASTNGNIEWSMFNVSGFKSGPKEFQLQTSGEDISPDAVLSSVFNTKRLTEIESNCTRQEYNPQKFYKWQKDGYKPLYAINTSHLTNFGTIFDLYIYEDYKEMVSSINRSGDGPMLRTENGSSVSSCTFKS